MQSLTQKQKDFRRALSKQYPELKTWGYKRLEAELKQIQDFLNDKNSSIGRQDIYWEQALIVELDKRDAKKNS